MIYKNFGLVNEKITRANIYECINKVIGNTPGLQYIMDEIKAGKSGSHIEEELKSKLSVSPTILAEYLLIEIRGKDILDYLKTTFVNSSVAIAEHYGT